MSTPTIQFASYLTGNVNGAVRPRAAATSQQPGQGATVTGSVRPRASANALASVVFGQVRPAASGTSSGAAIVNVAGATRPKALASAVLGVVQASVRPLATSNGCLTAVSGAVRPLALATTLAAYVQAGVRPQATALAPSTASTNPAAVFGAPAPAMHATGQTAQGASVSAPLAPSPRAFVAAYGAYAATTAPAPQATAAPGTLLPSMGLVYASVYVQASAAGYSVQDAQVNAAPRPWARAYAGSNVVAGAVSPRAYAYAPAPVSYSGFMMPNYPLFGGTLGAPLVVLSDALTAWDGLEGQFIWALTDLLTGSDAYVAVAKAMLALADGMTLADLAALIYQQNLADALIASGTVANHAQLTLLLADDFTGTDAASSLAAVFAALADSLHATLTLNTGADTYTAWVMTTETKAMRSYSNFPFNSYATLGGQLYGACATGIYAMGADTDAGTPIQATVRTGAMNLGSAKLKRIDRAYLGASAAGNLLLRVQATTTDNTLIEQTYRMTPAQPGIPGEHRVAVGRGFRSVYWTFELANDVDGADFTLYDWQVLPLALTGRVY